MTRVVVTPRPLAPPFRAPARRERLVADDSGLHWQRADGRTTTWAHGADDAPATVRVLSASRAQGLHGVPPGGLVIVGDAADRPLLAVPVTDWTAAAPGPGGGDPLRGTALRALVDALGLASRAPGSEPALPPGVPVAAVEVRWSRTTLAVAALAGVALALGTVLGVARGRSVPLAALGLLGLLGLVAVGVLPLLRARLAERRAAGEQVAVAGPRGGPSLTLVRTPRGGLELGAREADGVERWLPVDDGGVTRVRRAGAALDLLDAQGTVLLALDARRWLPDAAADTALTALCEAAGLERRDTDGRNAPAPVRDSDLPSRSDLWPADLPGAGLAAATAFFGLLNGWALLHDAQADGERPLGVAFLVLGALGSGAWLAARRRR